MAHIGQKNALGAASGLGRQLGLGQRLDHQLALGDVRERADVAAHLRLGVVQGRGLIPDPTRPCCGRIHAVFGLELGALVADLAPGRGHGRAVLGVHGLQPIPAQNYAARLPDDRGPTLVDKDIGPGRVGFEYADRRVLGQGAKAFLAGTDGLPGPLVLLLEAAVLQNCRDGLRQFLDMRNMLDDVIRGASFQGLDRDLLGPGARDDHHRRQGRRRGYRVQDLQAVKAQDVKIRDHNVEPALTKSLLELAARLGLDDLKIPGLALQSIADQFAVKGVVVNVQYTYSHKIAPFYCLGGATFNDSQ